MFALFFAFFAMLPRWRVGSFQHNYMAGGGHVGACRKHAYVHKRLMYMFLYDNTCVVLLCSIYSMYVYVCICSILLGAEAYAANTLGADLSVGGYGRAVGWSIQRTRQHIYTHTSTCMFVSIACALFLYAFVCIE